MTDLEGVVSGLIGDAWDGPPIRVAVLASSGANAYVLTSGHVYVTAGMLDLVCMEDDLAAVVAHELAHLDDLSAFDNALLGMDERFRIEAEADAHAVSLLLDAGFEPASLGRMILKLADEQPAGWATRRWVLLADRIGGGSAAGLEVP